MHSGKPLVPQYASAAFLLEGTEMNVNCLQSKEQLSQRNSPITLQMHATPFLKPTEDTGPTNPHTVLKKTKIGVLTA